MTEEENARVTSFIRNTCNELAANVRESERERGTFEYQTANMFAVDAFTFVFLPIGMNGHVGDACRQRKSPTVEKSK